MRGLVTGIRCGVFTVLCGDKSFAVNARGSLKKMKEKVVVGDYVSLDEENLIIVDKEKRNSYIKRPEIANIDQIVYISSLAKPSFSYFLICKYLTFANMYGIKAKLVLTKIDLDEFKEKESIIETFDKIGIDVYCVNNKTKEGIETLKEIFNGKITALVGQSGVGKSSLMNSLNIDFNREVGEYSEALGRGKHQTKETVLLPIFDGFIADTPGFSSLELEIKSLDLPKYFPAIKEYGLGCYFSDCSHIHENRCEVKKAIEDGKIPSIIYECYLKLMEEIKSNE